MAFAQLSKVRLEYVLHGYGPERIVFLHGLQASARIWQLVQRELPPERYASIAINHRGAGGSDAPPNEQDYSISIFADDVFELTGQIGWSHFTLVGHSLGGGTATKFAVEHQQMLKGLVLLDSLDPDGMLVTSEFISTDEFVDKFVAAILRRRLAGDMSDSIDASRKDVSSDVVRLLKEDILSVSEPRLRGSLRSMTELKIGSLIANLRIPVLVAGGDADKLVSAARTVATWAKFPSGTGLHIWHGVGHSPNLDCPVQFSTLLQKFIEETAPAWVGRPSG